jgi:hypothetical protein
MFCTCIRVFILNNVSSFYEFQSINKPNIYLERASLVAVIFAPLESVIHDRKPDGFHKAIGSPNTVVDSCIINLRSCFIN